MQKLSFVLAAVAVIFAAVIIFVKPSHRALAPTKNSNVETANTNSIPSVVMTTFSTADLPERDPIFQFSLQLPSTWRVEYLTGIKAIAIYDPASGEKTTLGQNRLFITAPQTADTSFIGFFSQQTQQTVGPAQVTVYRLTRNPNILFRPQPNFPGYVESDHVQVTIENSTPRQLFSVNVSPTVSSSILDTILKSFTFE